MSAGIVVLKFGSSVLRSEADLPVAVHAVYDRVRRGRRVVAVVSAMGRTTDQLLARAAEVADAPPDEAAAALLSTGERAAAALLTMALDAAGVPALLMDPADLRLAATGPRLTATPGSCDVAALRRALARHGVVVVPGFYAGHEDGGTCLLGRGGTDLTALFLAQQLGAPCRLVKDVPGVFDGDPATEPDARRYRALTFTDAATLGARVVQARALAFARRHDRAFLVGDWWRQEATRVGAARSVSGEATGALPMRVALLGAGNVGQGAYRALAALPDLFSVTGIAVRDVAKHRAAGLPLALLDRDATRVAAGEADVVVELMGGLEPAGTLVAAALEAGRHVVTANKALMAARGLSLERLAAARDVTLRCSAAVGGAVPMLEAVRRAAAGAGVMRLDAVLNGTCNFVLDRVADGVPFAEAVAEAQFRGFAEADPSLDLDGADAAQKLALLARAAWGLDVDWRTIERSGLRGPLPEPRAGGVLRLVASAQRTRTGCELEVRPVMVPVGHPLGRVRAEWNAIVITGCDGSRVVRSGRGAGGRPTALAVMADLLDLARARQAAPEVAAC